MGGASDPWPAYDAIVIGGGPAGATVGRLLSTWGHRVLIVTDDHGDTAPLAVSLPPSCVDLLRRLEVGEVLSRSGFQETTGNTAWWGDERTVAPFPEGRSGFQVLRDDLEVLLLSEAEGAGAHVQRGANAISVCTAGAPADDRPWGEAGAGGGPFRVGWRPEGEAQAPWVFDCTGRRGLLARRGLRVHEPGESTLALLAAWEADDWDLPVPSHTLVESYEQGWAWSIPISERHRWITVMVDPRLSELADRGRLTALYRSELNRTTHLRALVERGTLVDGPWGCSASPYHASRYGGPGWLLVGDAASFIDPLSSFGVKKAVASGWLAAIVAHTALSEPAMLGHALQLYTSRERAMYQAYRTGSRAFARTVTRGGAHPFWVGRAAELDPADPALGSRTLDVDALRADPDVQSAFRRLREAPAIRLGTGRRVEWVAEPTVRGRRVVMEERLATPAMPEPVRFIRAVDLGGVLELASRHTQVPDLFEAYCRVHEPVILPDFIGVLSVMLAKGLLEWREGSDVV